MAKRTRVRTRTDADQCPRMFRAISRELKRLREMLERLSTPHPFLTTFDGGRAQHRREGFASGDEKRAWLEQQLREHPEMSQQDIERELLPLRTPLPPEDQ